MTRIVLITGASSGIGKSMALYLMDQGLKVYGTSRNAQHGDQQEGLTMLQMDVTNDESVKEAIAYLISK